MPRKEEDREYCTKRQNAGTCGVPGYRAGADHLGGTRLSGRRRTQRSAGRLAQRTGPGQRRRRLQRPRHGLDARSAGPAAQPAPGPSVGSARLNRRPVGAHYRVRIVDEALAQRLVYIDFAADQPAVGEPVLVDGEPGRVEVARWVLAGRRLLADDTLLLLLGGPGLVARGRVDPPLGERQGHLGEGQGD